MKIIKKSSLLNSVAYSTSHLRPKVEFSKEQKEKIKTASEAALAIIAVCGIATIAIVAPNLLIAIAHIHKSLRGKKLSYREKQQKTAETFYYLKRYGLIKMRKTKGQWLIHLTKLGEERLKKLELNTLTITKPKRWDGNWWLVAADIPTKDYRWAADLFRKKIKELGFFPLQRTLWMCPYEPVNEIEYLANYYGIGKFITAMRVNQLDKDDYRKLKDFFKL